MTTRRPFLVRLWRKLFPKKPAVAAPIRLSSTDGKTPGTPARRPARSTIEPLEGRIAPAALLPGGKVLKYTDTDGDQVTITFSKAIFASSLSVATLNKIFEFSTGPDDFMHSTAPQQLQLIDLTQIPVAVGLSPASGVSFTETVVKMGGDGLADIGAINAAGISLGSVTLHGDLGHIDAGDGNSAMGVKSLNVGSLGVQMATQSGVPSFTSTISGELGSFTAGAVEGAYLHVVNGASKAIGRIGSIDIAHTLSANVLVAGSGAAPADDGVIQSASDIGSIKIGSGMLTADSPGGLIGGWGTNSGGIISGGKIGSLTINGAVNGGIGSNSASVTAVGTLGSITIGGNILGSDGASSGSIFATGAIGPVKILGSVTGGNGSQSASIRAGGAIGKVSIGTAANPGLIGGAGDNSGEINSGAGISSVTIVGDLHGGAPELNNGTAVTGSGASSSGSITAHGAIGAITIDGSILGGGAAGGGSISASGKIGPVKILGSVTGGVGSQSGTVHAGTNLGSVTIGTAAAPTGLLGNEGDGSGSISSGGSISKVTIFGNLQGGDPESTTTPVTGSTAAASGSIDATGALGVVAINGNIVGGGGVNSGEVMAGTTIGTVKILGSVTGGIGSGSGSIVATGNLGTVTIGTTQNLGLTGGAGDGSGTVSGGNITKVAILGNIQGGTPESTATPVAGSNAIYAGGVTATGKLGTVAVSGSLIGAAGVGSGFIEGVESVGSVKIGAAVTGGAGANSASIVSGGNFTSVIVGTLLSGGAGNNSGSIFGATAGVGTLGSVVIGGSDGVGELFGGTGNNSGSIISSGAIGSVTVNGPKIGGAALAGNTGSFSGAISAAGTIKTVKITGLVEGGAGDHSAAIQAQVLLGSVSVAGDITGGAGNASASISSLDSADGTKPGNITKVTAFDMTGGAGTNSGQISADGSIGSVNLSLLQAGTVSGTGAAISGSGAIISGAGILGVGAVGSLTVSHLDGAIDVNGHLGTLTVGSEATGATVHVADDLSSLVVHGSVTNSTFTALGQAVQGAKTDLAFGKIAITGAVSGSQFLAGYDVNGNAGNGNAQIGAVTVGGDWTASDLVAGTQAGADNLFGTSDDTAIGAGSPNIVSKIASVVIGGQVFGTADTTDHFGFVAELIGSFKVNKVAIPLQNGVAQLDGSTTADVTIFEVPVV